MKKLLSLLLLLGASSCTSETEANSAELRFSAIPDQNSTELVEKYSQIAAYLEGELGIPVTYVPSSDYSASVEAFKSGDVQLAWFGGLTGLRARAAVPGARAIAQGTVDPNYKSYFIAHKDTGLSPAADFPKGLAGKTFTFGSESSTSGRLMPEYFIRQETGQSPQEFFAGEEMSFSGDHSKTAALVNAGTYQGGAVNYKVYNSMVAEGKIDPAVCVKLWETPGYPDYNWTAHPDLGEEMIGKLQAALIGMEDPALLKALQRPEGIIEATNADFAPLEDLARELGLLR